MTSLIRGLALVAALVVPWGASQAAPATFIGENLSPAGTVSGQPLTERTNFLGALSAPDWTTLQNGLEGLSPGTLTSLNFGATSVGLSPAGVIVLRDDPLPAPPADPLRFNTTEGGSNFINVPGSQVGALAFDFSGFAGGGVNAFGFYATDVNLFVMSLLLVALDDTETTLSMGNSVGSAGNLVFWGFTDTETTYKSISILNTSGIERDSFGLDDFVVGLYRQGGTVSLPGSLALGLIGLAALAGSRRFQVR